MSFFPGVAVVLNIVLMVTGTQQPATRMTMLLTFGMSVAVLVHIAIVQMFNDQVVQRQNSRYRARWNSSVPKPCWIPTRNSAA